MLKTDWDKKICEEYGKQGEDGVRCSECPLRLPRIAPYGACRATYHWDKSREEWVPDDGCEYKDYYEVM